MAHQLAWPFAACSLALAIGFAACGGTANRSGFGDIEKRDGGSTIDGSDLDVEDPFLFGDGGDAANTVTRACSPDLKNVLDANGNVIETCLPDYGCGGGQCVLACDAAGMSKGNVGCDFVVSTPSFYPGIKPPCFAVFIANNWAKPVKITVTRGGQPYDATSGFARIAGTGAESTWQNVPATGIPEGKVAVLFLSHDPASVNGGAVLTCPVAPAVNANNGTAVPNSGPAGTGRGVAWSIKTDVPVSAYDIHPYGGAKSFLPSAEMILPTTAWGKNFIGVVPPKGIRPTDQNTAQWAQIVAHQDNTTVKIVPTQSLPAGTNVVAAPANQVATYTLNAGEYLQWQPTAEISGSVIDADKPIAFVGGQAYLCLGSNTSTGGGCDSGHQIIPPVSALGMEYVGAAFKSRRPANAPEAIPYRIVGAVAGTTLTYDPPVTGAPPTLGVGQMVDFQSTTPFIVRTQDANHPIYLAQLMPGCNVTGGSSLGDEEFVNMLPPAQYLAKYVFFTDPTYPTTNLVLVRKKTAQGFKDVSVDCLGVVTGWQPIGASDYEIAQPDLLRNGVGVNGCTNGPHTATSDAAFGLIVWGLDTYASYGYPAGGNVTTINTVVVPPVPR